MVFFNYSTMQMAAKIVYYGPGLCGKTTNLHYIFGHTTSDSRGEMVSLETETDRTLFFDLLPIDVGSIAGFNTRIQLYTVPGQVFYNTTRKLVLKGVDGVVFVADSQRAMLQANLDSFRNLEENLTEMGLSVDTLPLVLQFNKRDLQDIYAVDELNSALNRNGWPYFEASAVSGFGVFETLKGISKHTLLALKKRLGRSGSDAPSPRLGASRPAAAAAPPPAPSPASPLPTPLNVPTALNAAPVASPDGAASPPAAPPRSAPPGRTASRGEPSALLPDIAAALSPAGIASPQRSSPSSAGNSVPPAPLVEAPRSSPSASPGASGAHSRPAAGKSRSLDVLSELEKLRRQAMQPSSASGAHPVVSAPPPAPASGGTGQASPAPASPARIAAGNGRTELSRSIDMTLKRADFERARRFLVSFQLEDDQRRIVDAVHNLQVELKDTASLEKLLLRLNIALHPRE